MTAWHSLFLPGADPAAVAASLRASAAALGYTAFDPFDLVPGRSFARAQRLFVGPLTGGWVRVLGVPDERQLAPLSGLAPVLALGLNGVSAAITFWHAGESGRTEAFAPYLRAGCSIAEVSRIVSAHDVDADHSGSLPLDALPDDIRHMAGGVDLKQARSMFQRLTQSTIRRAGGDDQAADAARALLAAGAPPDWSSGGGARISRLMACLTVPDGWQTPDFTTLRDAYQLHLRRQRRPNADLYPGDAEALAAVPNALDYAPVYAGTDTPP